MPGTIVRRPLGGLQKERICGRYLCEFTDAGDVYWSDREQAELVLIVTGARVQQRWIIEGDGWVWYNFGELLLLQVGDFEVFDAQKVS